MRWLAGKSSGSEVVDQRALARRISKDEKMDPLHAQLMAKTFLEQLNVGLKDLFPDMAGKPDYMGDLTNLQRFGRHVYKIVTTLCGSYPASDDDVYKASAEWAKKINSQVLGAALLIPAFQIRWIWAGRWYAEGMPRVVWEHAAYPETLMASSADPECIEFAKPPWRAFLLDLPRRLLYSKSPVDGKPGELVQLLVMHHFFGSDDPLSNRWAVLADSPDCFELWRHGIKTGELLETGPEYHSELFKEHLDKSDDRIFLLLGRLIVGLCLTLSNPEKIREAKHTKQRRPRVRLSKQRQGDEPVIRTFVVGAPTKLKVRDVLQSFVEHGVRRGSSPTVQTLVRGHWKMQPYGPQSSLRKLIHLEPFWRGPEESPIMVKDHVV